MAQKKLYMGTNLKMYKTNSQTIDFLHSLDSLTKEISREDFELFVIPSYTAISEASAFVNHDRIKIGAQNMHWADEGQFTGEISPTMLKEIGADLVMIGHSERRHVLGESDFEEEKKVDSATKNGFRALLCVGETLEQKNYGLSKETLATQLKIGLHSISAEVAAKYLWIAYEPVWAIGVNGIPADEDYANAMHVEIKSVLAELFGEEIGASIPVLYGGSVNKENAVKFACKPAIDGLFIGRSAWNADNFYSLICDVQEAVGK